MENVVNFVMDMAMEKVGAESGSVLFADVNGRELYFATARGPKANEIMDYRVPMGKGIVGFCTREGVSLAISDAPNDPRFYKAISESLGYETEGLVCAPIQYEGRVYGALELMNKKSGTGFTADEMNALSYMGRQLAQYVHDTIMRREKIE
ncbi:GAF domain-containing protein [Persicimonas caeni]